MDYIKDLYAKIKAWFIGVADQDGDGDVDKEDVKIVAKKTKTAVKKTATKAKLQLRKQLLKRKQLKNRYYNGRSRKL